MHMFIFHKSTYFPLAIPALDEWELETNNSAAQWLLWLSMLIVNYRYYYMYHTNYFGYNH